MARGHGLLVSKVNDISAQLSARVEEATQEMREEVEMAQTEVRRLREQVSLQQKKTALLQREMGEKERAIEELEETHRKNMAVIQALSQSNQKIHEFKEQGAFAERELQVRSDKLTELSAKLEELGAQYSAALRDIEQLKESLSGEQRRGDELENGLTLKQRALNKVEEELKEIRRGLERAREVEGQERRSSQEAQVVISELKDEIERLMLEKQTFEMEKLRLIEVNEQMGNQLDRLQRDVASKQQEVRSLQDVERQLVVEKSQRENMNNVLMYLMSQVDEPTYKRKKN
jgi:chromosome segregation ATPase